jgi:putative membrane protein
MFSRKILGIAMAAALVGGLSAAGAAGAADKASEKFIKEAVEGNLAEVQVGQLAQQKGESEGVKTFGGQLQKDHSAANEKVTALANKLGVTPPTEPNKKQKAIHDRLSKLNGAAFDKAFAKAMVDDHKEDIGKFEKQAKKKNDPTADLANEILPDLRKHLEMAQSLVKDTQAKR